MGTSKNRIYLSLEELQREEFKLLQQFDMFCSTHGLRYSLHAGTLLGAIRHKGFIPWDDDVDVSMPRPDYDRLLSLADCMPEPLRLVTPYNSAFPLPFSKVMTTEIRAQEEVAEGALEEYLWIDIFAVDGAYVSDRENAKVQGRLNRATRMSMWEVYGAGPKDSIAERIVKTAARPFCKAFHAKKRMLSVVDSIVRAPGYEHAERVSSFMAGLKVGWSLPKEGFEAMVMVEFNGCSFPVMGCWEECLSKNYGDYMTIPPADKQVTHLLKAWRV